MTLSNMLVARRIGIEFNEEIDPNVSRQPDDHRHKNNQSAHNGDKSVHQIGTNNQKRNDKGRNCKGYADPIADIHGAIKERRLYFVLCATVRTTFVHLEDFGQGIRISVHVHALLMALGTTSC